MSTQLNSSPPTIEEAVQEYRKAVSPLSTQEEYALAYEEITSFLENGAKILHEEVLKDIGSTEYIRYMNEYIVTEYCTMREPLPLASNFGIHSHSFEESHMTYTLYIAKSIYALSLLCHDVCTYMYCVAEIIKSKNTFAGVDTIPYTLLMDAVYVEESQELQDLLKERNFTGITHSSVLKSMVQKIYTCFGFCKKAHKNQDEILYTIQPQYYTIHYNGSIYAVPLYKHIDTYGDKRCFEERNRKELYSFEAVYAMVQEIYTCTHNKEHSPIEYLSYMGSDTVAQRLEQWEKIPSNALVIQHIQKSAFSVVLCGEEYCAEKNNDVAYPYSHPVWTYVSSSLLLWNNAQCTGYFEHSLVDGLHGVHFLENMYRYYTSSVVKESVDILESSSNSHKRAKDIIEYIPLHYTYSEEEEILYTQYEHDVAQTYENIRSAIYEYNISDVEKKYKNDAFIQCMLQYALYSVHGFIPCVYEPVGISAYSNGRVEAMRPVSKESVEFVHDVYSSKKWNTLLATKAFEEHNRRIMLCKQGKYFSRYYAMLYAKAQKEKMLCTSAVETFFTSNAYERVGSDILVTSNIGSSPIIQHFFYIRENPPFYYNLGYTIYKGVLTSCFTYYKDSYDMVEKMNKACIEWIQIYKKYIE